MNTATNAECEMRNAELSVDPAPFIPNSEFRNPHFNSADRSRLANAGLTAVAVVVPCYNEQGSLSRLRTALLELRKSLADGYALQLVLVDDGSTDDTWQELGELFGAGPNVRLLRHPRNRGVAAAIMTGLRAAEAEIVCSIDSDCTYDPAQLREMIPLVEQGADLVTASPYHPQGAVRGVPPWRVRLSKFASWLYRRVLRRKLFTYTSCFRVYRRSAVADVVLANDGFVGVAELLWQMDRRRARIVEAPAELCARTSGQSKMRIVRASCGHLRLLARAAVDRLFVRSRQHRNCQ
jgi:dolichol-phosphate mannosyltransferase